MTLTEAQKAALGAIIRSVLLIAFAGLTQHRLVDGRVLGLAIDDLTAQLVGIFGAGLVIVWSLIEKWWASRKVKVALVMPAASTETQLNVVMKKTSPGLIPIAPIPSQAEAAAIVDETQPGGSK